MGSMHEAGLRSVGGEEPVLLGVTASSTLNGRLLEMRLEQRYRNNGKQNVEVVYTFPLPYGAVLLGVEVALNGKPLAGEVTARAKARARYEKAVEEGDSGILLEQNHDGSYTLELGNLLAGEECLVAPRYAQVLPVEHGQLRLMLPTTLAPRYGDPVRQGGLQPHQVPETDALAEYPFSIGITLQGSLANAQVACLSHPTSCQRSEGGLHVALQQRGHLDRDFILLLSALPAASDALACPDALVNGQSALLAFLNPAWPAGMGRSAYAAKILVDCSGSMGGDSIQAARKALAAIVNQLSPEDRFSLSRFGSTVEHRGRGLWRATPQAKASAQRWISALEADLGGTEMANALRSTLAIAHEGACDILLVTDGGIAGIDELIEVSRASNHRIFVVAIGASPAEVHLRRLAAATGGQCDFVAPGEDVGPAVLRMSSRMHGPRAGKLRLEWPAGMSVRWQQALPAQVFENDAMTVAAFATCVQPLDGDVRLWGVLDGGAEQLLASARLEAVQAPQNTPARMVAHACYRQAVAMPMESARNDVEARQAPDLAVQYQLITAHTNFILVHKRAAGEQAQEMPMLHKVKQMLAAGWGGTGSVRHSRAATPSMALPSPAMVSASALPSYDGLGTPSVWRTNRTLSMPSLDCDVDYAIPAFLRSDSMPAMEPELAFDDVPPPVRDIDRTNPHQWVEAQADIFDLNGPAFSGPTPAGLRQWLQINVPAYWPTTYQGLRTLGLWIAITEWLEFEAGHGRDEAQVVAAFLQAVLALPLPDAPRTPTRTAPGVLDAVPADLQQGMQAALAGCTATAWPETLVVFPAGVGN